MFRLAGKRDEIGRRIVLLILVIVVDNFPRLKRPTKFLLCNNSMGMTAVQLDVSFAAASATLFIATLLCGKPCDSRIVIRWQRCL